jgi:hypothetical protein
LRVQATNSTATFDITTDGEGIVSHARTALLTELADGGDALSDLAILRDQPELFGPVASTPTAWRVIEHLAQDPDGLARIRAARAHARARAWRAGGSPDPDALIVIDVDGTLVLSHADDKEGAAGTFKHTFGFHPLLAYLDRGGWHRGGAGRGAAAGQRGGQCHRGSDRGGRAGPRATAR